MLKKLQEKWGVTGWRFLLIFLTFALGGSLCGFLGRQLLVWSSLEKNFAWYVLYIALITLLWPLCVLVISIPMGQYRFFKAYLQKMRTRIFGRSAVKDDAPLSIAIFASGAGTNARRIIEHFTDHPRISVALIVSNKPQAGVLNVARAYQVPYVVLGPEMPLSGEALVRLLQKKKISLIVLAGFLLKIPPNFIKAFAGRIINIHPALLPSYGGKGMYGQRVHEAVIKNKDKTSGISIHFVDEIYDHGEVAFQATCPVFETDDASSLASRIHELEHEHYPRIIEEVLEKQKRS